MVPVMLASLSSAVVPEVFASLGSNEQREHHIRSGVQALHAEYGELRLSSVYQNKAVGFDGEDFLNMVVAFHTEQTAAEVQACFHRIEADHGRERGLERYSPRTLDIDQILYGDEVLPGYKVPRVDIVKYAFVLCPLAELAPDGIHPLNGLNYRQMWEEFNGDRELRLIPFDFGL